MDVRQPTDRVTLLGGRVETSIAGSGKGPVMGMPKEIMVGLIAGLTGSTVMLLVIWFLIWALQQYKLQ